MHTCYTCRMRVESKRRNRSRRRRRSKNEEDNDLEREERRSGGREELYERNCYQERERVVSSRILYFRSSSVVNLMSRISSFLRAVSPGDWRRKDVTVNSDRDGNIIETETHRRCPAKNSYPPFIVRLSSNPVNVRACNLTYCTETIEITTRCQRAKYRNNNRV